MQKSLILTGMPGCGKSTAGVLLAKALGLPFIDTDLLLQCREGLLLQDFIALNGVEAFLDAEEQAVRAIPPQAAVIATGGSAVLREKAMTHLRGFGTVVFLDVECGELLCRIGNIKTRGIAIPPGQSFADIYRHRRPYYQRSADFTVESTRLSTEQTVERIIRHLRGQGQ